jgi:group I intron endonuclease
MNNNYYVYVYLDPTKKCKSTYSNISFLYEPFYIGKGKGERHIDHLRPYKLNKKTYISNRINKIKKSNVNPFIIKIKENITEEEALSIEVFFISLIGRRNLNTGTLVNITDGGEGVSGLKHTLESRLKMSNKGEKHPNWGKHLNVETRKKISERLKVNNPMCNPEIAEKVRLKNLGREPWNKGLKTPADVCKKLSEKKIKYKNIQLISKIDSSILTFNTIREVMNFIGVTHRSVLNYILKGESKDYHIKYETNYQ